jgi:hypothetical protein
MTASVAAGASISSAVPISGFRKYAIECPTFSVGFETANATVRVEVCQTSTGTFRDLYALGVNSAYSGMGAWEVPSNVGGFAAVCEPLAGFKYAKVKTILNTASAAVNFVIHCIE